MPRECRPCDCDSFASTAGDRVALLAACSTTEAIREERSWIVRRWAACSVSIAVAVGTASIFATDFALWHLDCLCVATNRVVDDSLQ